MHQIPELPLDRDALKPPLDTAAKRASIETELRKDAGRSDREIARVVGVDHKTGTAARERLGIASPLGNYSAPATWRERNKASPNVTEMTVTEASPSVSNHDKCPPPPGVVDEPKYDPFDPVKGDMVIPGQPAIAVYENIQGAIVIIQENSDPHEEDPVIRVRPEHVEKLIAKLRQVAKDALS
jgi:hypothetical protein